MNPELTLLHVHGDSIGYGRLGVRLAEALAKQGVEVYDDLGGPGDEATKMSQDMLENGRRRKLTNAVCWVSVPGHARGWYDGQHAAVFTMWEAMTLPEAFRENLHEFDTLVVPSDQNVELFSNYHPNVRKCLLGVDPKVWHQTERPKNDGVRFDYLIGGSGQRKGVDLAIRAFRKVWGKDGSWGDGPIPHLVMKSPKGVQEAWGLPRVEVISGRVSPETEVALYASAHCYLQPSRGEGFGLQPLQAIAQGCPTILTNAHGHASFAHLGYGLSTKPSKADYFIYGDAGEWWEPSLDELCEYMRWVYDNYDSAVAAAKVGAEVVAREFTWANCADQFVDAFDGELSKPYAGPGDWVQPESKLYEIVTLKDWTADIAGKTYHFQRGRSYYEQADVKRILFEADLLDPICLQAYSERGDTGLTPGQVEKIGAYSAAHEHCPTCGGRLNRGPTKADEIFEEMTRA